MLQWISLNLGNHMIQSRKLILALLYCVNLRMKLERVAILFSFEGFRRETKPGT